MTTEVAEIAALSHQLNEVAVLARHLMNEHGLNHWVFKFDRAKRRAGCCKYRRLTITVSAFYAVNNSIEEIKDTILHEIAHALAGVGHNHDNYWKSICVRIGANPQRCYDHTKVVMPKGRWYAKCPNCNKEFRCHRRPKNHTNRYCPDCGRVKGAISFCRICAKNGT